LSRKKATAETMETVELATEAMQEAPAKSGDEKPQQLIYIGPSLPHGVLAQHTVFRDGVPKYLDEVRQKYPQVDTLIVPVAQLLKAQAELQRKGTEIQQAYQALSRKG
jgi:hypothetical protein